MFAAAVARVGCTAACKWQELRPPAALPIVLVSAAASPRAGGPGKKIPLAGCEHIKNSLRRCANQKPPDLLCRFHIGAATQIKINGRNRRLTADSPPDAPQPADDSAAVVARLELFTGASADAAREALRAHGNDADAAAAALLGSIPDTRATDDDLAAIRRLRAEENASAPPTPSTSGAAAAKPSVKEMKAAIAAAGLATADLLERADVEARYAEARAPAASDADLAAIRRLRDEQNGSMAQQLAEARRKRAAHHASRPPPVVESSERQHVWFEHEDTFAKRMAAIARECAGADSVGFQEVTDDSFPFLEAALNRQGFHSLLKQETPAPYYCCVAAKKPLRQVRTHPFPRSMMGRGVLSAVASWGDVDVHVGVVTSSPSSARGTTRPCARNASASSRRPARAQGRRAPASRSCWATAIGTTGTAPCRYPVRTGATPGRRRLPARRAVHLRRARTACSAARHQNATTASSCSTVRSSCSKLARVAGFALVGTARPDLTMRTATSACCPRTSDHFGALATLAPAGQARGAGAPKRREPAPVGAASFAPRTKGEGATVVPRRGDPDGWQLVDGALLVGRSAAPAEFDATRGLRLRRHARLSTGAGRTRGRPAHAPRLFSSSSPTATLLSSSNECLDRYKRLDYLEKKMRDKCSKIQAWAADVNVPVLALIALSKQDETKYHKSQGDGMWRKACADRGVSGGFYVGDSADDESLARFAGVPFHHVKEFFERMHKAS